MKLKALPLLVLLGALTAAPSTVHAQEGGLLSPDTGMMVWTLIVFGIVLVVLMRFAYPYILGAVEAREKRIEELLAAAARDREEARALLEQQQREHEELRSQAQQIFADARASGERLKEELLAEARRDQESLLQRARRDIEAERDQVLDEVRRETVEIVMAAAEKLVQRNLDDEQNRRLVRDFLGEVGRGAPSLAAGV